MTVAIPDVQEYRVIGLSRTKGVMDPEATADM